MKPTYLMLIALVGLGAGSDYEKPNSEQFTKHMLLQESRLQAPPGYAQLVDRTQLLGGYFVNDHDAFYYAGDKLSFQSFLDAYSTLTNVVAHTVVKCHGITTGGPPWERTKFVQYDWALYCHPYGAMEPQNYPVSKEKFVVWIELRLGGLISEKDGQALKIPKGVQVIYVNNQ